MSVTVGTSPFVVKRIVGQHLLFLFVLALSFVLLRAPLAVLFGASLHDDTYSHVFFIPFISASLIYFRKTSVFQESDYCFVAAPLLLAAAGLYWIIQRHAPFPDQHDYLSCAGLVIVLVWVAAFLLCYGLKPLRAALFPLCFLLFMIPMPAIVLDRAVDALQRGSADMTKVLFRILGVPALWGERAFSLNGYHFEIATECSGIHSCLVLFLASVLVGHLFIRSAWAKVCFSFLTVVVAIFKNAVRVAAISSLTAYVDEGYYSSWLHRNGGIVFSLVAMAILVPLLLALQKGETCTASFGKRN